MLYPFELRAPEKKVHQQLYPALAKIREDAGRKKQKSVSAGALTQVECILTDSLGHGRRGHDPSRNFDPNRGRSATCGDADRTRRGLRSSSGPKCCLVAP